MTPLRFSLFLSPLWLSFSSFSPLLSFPLMSLPYSPNLLCRSAAQIAFVKSKIAAGLNPWTHVSIFLPFTSSFHSSSGFIVPYAVPIFSFTLFFLKFSSILGDAIFLAPHTLRKGMISLLVLQSLLPSLLCYLLSYLLLSVDLYTGCSILRAHMPEGRCCVRTRIGWWACCVDAYPYLAIHWRHLVCHQCHSHLERLFIYSDKNSSGVPPLSTFLSYLISLLGSVIITNFYLCLYI